MEEKVEEEMEEEKLLYHLCRPNTYILIPPSSKDLFVGSGDMKRQTHADNDSVNLLNLREGWEKKGAILKAQCNLKNIDKQINATKEEYVCLFVSGGCRLASALPPPKKKESRKE